MNMIALATLLSSIATVSNAPCDEGMAADYPCSRVDLAAFVPIQNIGGSGQSLNDVWGWTDPDSGREFAVVGRSGGTSFVEVSDPTDPVYLGELPTRSLTANRPGNYLQCHDDCDGPGGPWRDAKVYQNHAFIVSEEADHGLQVFDLTRLLDVSPGEPQTFDEDAHYSGFGNAHNIELNVESGMAFAVGTSNQQAEHNYNGGPHFVDVSDPTNPVHAGGYGADGYTHDAQCVIYQGPDATFTGREICFNSNENSLTIVDVTDRDAPEQISRTNYSRVGYTHQGWLSEEQGWFYLNDELADSNDGTRTRTVVFDVSDLSDPQVATEYFSPDIAIAHNNYVRGEYLYQSNYTSGLRILDISSRDAPVEFAYLDSQPNQERHVFQGTWSNFPWFESGTVVFTDIGAGLFVVRPQLPDEADGEADLKLSASNESIGEGGRDWSLTSRVTVENIGPQVAEAVEFVASLPDNASLTLGGQAPGDCQNNGRVLRCRYGDLGSGESFVVDLSAEADEAVDAGLMVWATSALLDPETADNRLVLPQDGDSPDAGPPEAAFSVNCNGLSCQLDASASSGDGAILVDYDWDLGDGSTASGKTLSHDYEASGDYTITLVVTDSADGQDETSQTVSVEADQGSSYSSSGCSLNGASARDATLPGLLFLTVLALWRRGRAGRLPALRSR